MILQLGSSQDSLDGRSQDSSDATTDEFMALIITWMHLMLNLRTLLLSSKL